MTGLSDWLGDNGYANYNGTDTSGDISLGNVADPQSSPYTNTSQLEQVYANRQLTVPNTGIPRIGDVQHADEGGTNSAQTQQYLQAGLRYLGSDNHGLNLKTLPRPAVKAILGHTLDTAIRNGDWQNMEQADKDAMIDLVKT